jgi:hypothetical protein
MIPNSSLKPVPKAEQLREVTAMTSLLGPIFCINEFFIVVTKT